MLANYLIGLREGLEAVLIVSILLAYLTRVQRPDLRRAVWTGVSLAVTLAVGLGAVLQITNTELEDEAQEAFAGIMSVVAVGLVTWMVLWMAARARTFKAELEGQVGRALEGGATALGVIAFVAVIREGLETALFLWSGANSTGDGDITVPLIGALLGLATAVLIGIGLYRGVVSLDLGRLLRWSGALLVVIAAGVLAYAVHEFTEVGWIPGEDAVAFDVSGVIAPDSWLAALLRGFFNFRPVTTWPEFAAWVLYLVPVMWIFIRRSRPTQRVTA